MKTSIVLLACIALAGCSWNRAHFSETTLDGYKTEYTQTAVVTVGSKQQSGTGDMKYQGTGKNPWKLSIGNAATGQEAYDPTQVLLKGLELGAGLATGGIGALIPKPDVTIFNPDELPKLTLTAP